MNQQVLIDAIVRQTTVLIARLSTVQGVRSPLSHIANEVFVGLVQELENQGVGKKVIADMFGLALRSYRQKVQRLSESASVREVTLWSAVQSFLSERERATREEVLQHFRHDEELSVRGILNDLVESGLVLRSGGGGSTSYRAASAEELDELGTFSRELSEESTAALVWVHVYRESPIEKERLSQLLPLPPEALDQALATLLGDGRIRLESSPTGDHYLTTHCIIPIGESKGWEAAIIDHHRAVLNALAAKVSGDTHSSTKQDEVGGTTLTFDLWPGHPREAEVRKLLESTRESVIALWDEVTEYNQEQESKEAYQLTFYCGQYLVKEEDEA
jgi:hypothetical protein